MDAYQRYDHFASGYGAGYDAAGNPTFSPGGGYASPSEKAKMMSHMHSLGADVAAANINKATAAQQAMQQRAMQQQDQDRDFQKNMMAQNANRNYELQNKKLGLLGGLIRNF